MKLNRLKIAALCLGMAIFVMTGSAMASTTVVYPLTTSVPSSLGNAGPVLFATEQGAANAIWSFPGATNCSGYNAVIAQKMNVIRQFNLTGSPQNYFVNLVLDNGGIWQTAPASPVWIFTNQGVSIPPTISLITSDPSTGVGTATLRYYVRLNDVLADLSLNTIYIPLGQYTVRDPLNRIGIGQSIGITVTELDGATLDLIETSQTTLMQGSLGTIISQPLVVGAAVIDTLTNRATFVDGINVTNTGTPNVSDDHSASIGINNATGTVFTTAGCRYELSALASIQIVITGNFANVSKVCYGSTTDNCKTVTGSPATVTINIPGDNSFVRSSVTNRFHFIAKNPATSQLVPQTFTFTVREILADSTVFTLVNGGTSLTVWTLNGTILTAVWQNGNGGPLGTLNGRMYVWNPSNQAGLVIAQVYTIPVGMVGSTLLGTVNLGTLPPVSATNIRVYEDILNSVPALVTFPYTDNGGNVLIVLTINASNCHGWSNVFGIFNGNYVSFGVTPMVEQTGLR